MKEILDRHPAIADHAREAIRRAGLEPRTHPIRGGTDGCRLSFMRLPTRSLFAGEHNFHSRPEWVSVQDMEKAVAISAVFLSEAGEGVSHPGEPRMRGSRTQV